MEVEDHNDPQNLRLTLQQPVQRLRLTVAEIHESESVDPEDPPRLNISEVVFLPEPKRHERCAPSMPQDEERLYMRKIAVMLLLTASLPVSLYAQAQTPVKVAILPGVGDRVPKAGVVELLAAELSKQDGVVVLEREAIGKVLAEQKLTGAVTTNLATAVRMGRLMAADILVVIERLGKEQPFRLRVLVIETSTSVVLADLLREETEIEKDATLLRDCLKLGLVRWKTAPKERRYVAILAFRSEELGHALDGVAAGVGVLLSVDLNASPTVILLDPANAQRLQTERELTAMVNLTSNSSMIGIEGDVPAARRSSDVPDHRRFQYCPGASPFRERRSAPG